MQDIVLQCPPPASKETAQLLPPIKLCFRVFSDLNERRRLTQMLCVAQDAGLLVPGLAAGCPHTPSTQHPPYQVHAGPVTSISLAQLNLPAEFLQGTRYSRLVPPQAGTPSTLGQARRKRRSRLSVM